MKDNNVFDTTSLPFFVQDFINHLADLDKSRNTLYAYVNELRLFLQFLCDTLDIFPPSYESVGISYHMDNINQSDIEAYLRWARIERNNGMCALARKQAVIKSLYRYLLSEHLIREDVTINLDAINVNLTLPKALIPIPLSTLTGVLLSGAGLSKQQLKYHEYTEKRNYAIFLTFIGTGLHLSELCNLNLSSTNLNKGCFEVIHKGNKVTTEYFNTEIFKALNDYLQNERQRYAQEKSDAFFLSIQGKRMSKRAVQNLVTKYMSILKTLGHNTDGFVHMTH